MWASVRRNRPTGPAATCRSFAWCRGGSRPRSFNSLGWEIYPQGLRLVLRRFSRWGLPLVVTENGIATCDEALRDRFVAEHLQSLDEARNDGLRVLGYFYWSLIDNFEWT